MDLQRTSDGLSNRSVFDVVPKLLRPAARILLFLLLYLDSRAWFEKTNFVDVTGAREAFLALLLLFFLCAVLPGALVRMRLSIDAWFILSIIGFVLVVSSVGSYLVYGQPIYAGMIEQRRVLAYLIFFPVLYAIRSKLVTPRTILNCVTTSAVICVINSALYYLLVGSAKAVEALTSEASARAGRNTIGLGFVLTSVCYVLSRYVEEPKLRWALLWLLFVFDVIVFQQGRQTIVAVGAASVLILLQSRIAMKRMALTFLVLISVVFPFIWNSVLMEWKKYLFLFRLLSEDRNLRVYEVHTVMLHNLLVPHGALWAQWNGGFSRYFGPNFFLSDIGIFGEIFSYGVILFAILMVSYYGFIYNSLRASNWNVITRTCAAAMFILVILQMFQPVIEHGGYDVGILLALLASQRRLQSIMNAREAGQSAVQSLELAH